MNICYLCGKEFNEDVKKHDEHIIQQAVGGNLTENDILCSSCGGNLGKEIDVPFCEIFDGIATRLDIKKDRNNSKQSSTSGKYINLKYKLMTLPWSTIPKKMNLLDFQYQHNSFCMEIREIEVLWKNFKVTPVKPFHRYMDNKKVIIYSSQKQYKQYKIKIEKEILEKYGEFEKPEITNCDDLEGIIEYPFNMKNKAFKKGLAKIAIGFASKNNIQREDLPLVLAIDDKTKRGKILDEILAIQFYPLSIIDRLIEVQKNEFQHYPFHNLILFTLDYNPKIPNGKKVLMCYIELFSTFQWYVVLNDQYYGESIYKFYAQQILKKNDYVVELGRRYYKERNIWLDPLGITEEYIEKKYNSREDKNKSRWNIEEQLIQEETIKQKYKFDFESYIRNIVSGISNQVLVVQQKEKFQNTYFHKFLGNNFLMNEYKIFSDAEYIMKFKQNLDLFFLQDYDETFSIYCYRKLYVEDSKLKNYTDLVRYKEILNNSQAYKIYGHQKMRMLENYIQNENIKHKIKHQS